MRLRRKDVPRLRVAPLDLAGAGLLEALGRARMGFQLGHFFSRFSDRFLARTGCRSLGDREIPALVSLIQYT